MELLLDTVKWSAVVGAAALVLTALKPALDRRYSARWRYWVWLVMAALLLLAPVQWEKLAPRTAAVLPAAEPPVVVEVPQLSISREEGLVLRRSGSAPSVPAETVRRVDLDSVLPRVWLAGGAAWGLWRLLGTALFLRRPAVEPEPLPGHGPDLRRPVPGAGDQAASRSADILRCRVPSAGGAAPSPTPAARGGLGGAGAGVHPPPRAHPL